MKNSAYYGQILDMASQKPLEFWHEKCHATYIINRIIVLLEQHLSLGFVAFCWMWRIDYSGDLRIHCSSVVSREKWINSTGSHTSVSHMLWYGLNPKQSHFSPPNFPYLPTFVKVNLCLICLKDFASDFYPMIMTVTLVCHPFYSAGATASKTVVSCLGHCFMDAIFNNLQNSSTAHIFLKCKCSSTSSVLKNWTYSLAENQIFAMKMCWMVWD